ncbi:MAG: amidohydrolase family protein, partial [Burkholderiales bacterium]|nr:amidohydrolase family protein [Burkholderiales bacterium]
KTKGSIEVGKLADFVILSRDPTQGDPNTIDRIKVTETIKEGKAIYVLDAAEQRKAELMIRPDAKGNNAFANVLVAMATQRELDGASTDWQRTAMARFMTGARHDPACVTSVMSDLVAAMTAGATAQQ